MTSPRRAELTGASVAYVRAGAGPPLLLLHGDGESHRSWKEVMPRLAEGWDVIAPDLPGFGDSARSDEPTPERLVAWLIELLDHLDIGRVAIVGSSLGGLLAVRLARAVPERVRGLVLVDAAGLGVTANPLLGVAALPGAGELNVATAAMPLSGLGRARARALLLFADPRRAPAWWRRETRRLTRPDAVRTSVASRRSTLGPLGQRKLVLDDLRHIEAPTLVVWGREDMVFPVAQGRAAVERLPDGRLAVIPRCGHLPHVEQPARFLAEVEPFLSRLGAAAGVVGVPPA